MINEKVLDVMKKKYGNRSIKIPKGIVLEELNEDIVRITLSGESVQTKNMQINDNAFEGWGTAIYAAMDQKIKIILDVDKHFQYDQYEKNGHLGRFLYRAYCFSRQYDWFELSDYLEEETSRFMKYLKGGTFINNLPNAEAGTKLDHNKENIAEAEFSKSGVLLSVVNDTSDIGTNIVYRQLPVGLFKDEVNKNNTVFTGGKSAIDLWTLNGDTIHIVELKALNKMVGIVTEIFFYSNYMKDLLFEDGLFSLNKDINKIEGNDRGYSCLVNGEFKHVNGMMLADIYHPLINSSVLEVLNSGNEKRIHYDMVRYKWGLTLSKV